MSSGAALLRRVRTIERKFTPPVEPRVWNMELEEGEELSEELRAQMGPFDTVIIRHYPAGFLGEDEQSTSGQVMYCWVDIGHGKKKPLIIRQYEVDISQV